LCLVAANEGAEIKIKMKDEQSHTIPCKKYAAKTIKKKTKK